MVYLKIWGEKLFDDLMWGSYKQHVTGVSYVYQYIFFLSKILQIL